MSSLTPVIRVTARQEDEEGNLPVSLIFAWSRVAPLKYTTITRLESTAAIMAARIASMNMSELDVKELFYWSDSQTVLSTLATTLEDLKHSLPIDSR